MDVTGENKQGILTGQVCFQHREVDHGPVDEQTPGGGMWCNNCGKNNNGEVLGKANGGWS